jgi:hypothetical protein
LFIRLSLPNPGEKEAEATGRNLNTGKEHINVRIHGIKRDEGGEGIWGVRGSEGKSQKEQKIKG